MAMPMIAYILFSTTLSGHITIAFAPFTLQPRTAWKYNAACMNISPGNTFEMNPKRRHGNRGNQIDQLFFMNDETTERVETVAAESTPIRNKAGLFRNNKLVFDKLDTLYTHSTTKIKCPFFRRRVADVIDGVAMILRFLTIRHKSLIGNDFDSILKNSVPPGCRCEVHNRNSLQKSEKCRGLSIERIADIIYFDWTKDAGRKCSDLPNKSIKNKSYYITGKLTNSIYRDDCLFDGPDPDMPVRGLRKYLSAASKLFDHKKSYADLLDLQILQNGEGDNNKNRVVVARWRIGGVIMLPWKPTVKPYTGKTLYHIDEEGLIYLHEEIWDISVIQAFVSTMFPEVGDRIWGQKLSLQDDVSGINVAK